MKRVLFFIAIMICAVMSTKAQLKTYATFNNIYNVRIDKTTSGYDVYVDASNDEMSQTGFIITDKELPLFLKTAREAKAKYIEWSKISKENNVTDFNKNIGTSFDIDGFFMYGGVPKLASKVPFRWKFSVIKMDGKVIRLISLRSDKMVANSNKYMEGEQMYLLFTDVNKIDEFLSCLDKEKIDTAFRKENEVADLFK